jgi:hypothetical protein
MRSSAITGGCLRAFIFDCRSVSKSFRKNWILVQDQGGGTFQPAGILRYVVDLKRVANADIGPKDFFEMASIHTAHVALPIVI